MGDETSLTSDTFLLTRPVTDLGHLVAEPHDYLVSIYENPKEAARVWFDQPRRSLLEGDGLVRLRWNGADLIAPDMWDDVDGIWTGVVEIVDSYLDDGRGEAWFRGQPIAFSLVRVPGAVLWSCGPADLRSTRLPVDDAIASALLLEAKRFFEWRSEWVGGNIPPRLVELLDQLPE